MEYIEKIRNKLKLDTKYKFAKKLRKSPQAYDTLIGAEDRIKYRDLIALRRVSRLSDTELLNLIEDEIESRFPEIYRELPELENQSGSRQKTRK